MPSTDEQQLRLKQEISELYQQLSRLDPRDTDYQDKVIAINEKVMGAEDELKILQTPVQVASARRHSDIDLVEITEPVNGHPSKDISSSPVVRYTIESTNPITKLSRNGMRSDMYTKNNDRQLTRNSSVSDMSDGDSIFVSTNGGVGSPRSPRSYPPKPPNGLTKSSSVASISDSGSSPMVENTLTVTAQDDDDDIEILGEVPSAMSTRPIPNSKEPALGPLSSPIGQAPLPVSPPKKVGLPAPAPSPSQAMAQTHSKNENETKPIPLHNVPSTDSITGLKRSYSTLFEKSAPAVKQDPSSDSPVIDLTDETSTEKNRPPEPFNIGWYQQNVLPPMPLYQRAKAEKVIREMINHYLRSGMKIRGLRADKLAAKRQIQFLDNELSNPNIDARLKSAYTKGRESNAMSIVMYTQQINDELVNRFNRYRGLLLQLRPGVSYDWRALEAEFITPRRGAPPPVHQGASSSARDILSTMSDDRLRGVPHEVDVDETKQIDNLLRNIESDAEVDPSALNVTVEGLAVELFDHQKIGLTWLLKMERSASLGGILADDMGLGKTVQLISLIIANPPPNPGPGTRPPPTLIIAPVALLQQWEQEIRSKVKPSHHLRVKIHHGSAGAKAMSFKKLSEYDVIITTFRMISGEYREHFNVATGDITPGTGRMRGDGQPLPKSPFFTDSWYRVILDEAQAIKNRRSLTSVACCALQSRYRWCLSGTPMQNSIDEFQSLLGFLRIQPYNNASVFNRDIGLGIRAGRESSMNAFRALLRAVLLRRTKNSKINGKPILSLPSKSVEKILAKLEGDEVDYYMKLESGAVSEMNKYFDDRTAGKNFSNILTLLLRLRQACCHPRLTALSSHTLAASKAVTERESGALPMLRRMPTEMVNRIINSSENFVCPSCLDAVSPASTILYVSCGHHVCAECNERLFDESTNRNGPGGTKTISCPSCLSTVLSIHVCRYDTFNKVFMSGLSDREIMDEWKSARDEELRARRDRMRNMEAERQKRLEESMFVDELASMATGPEDVNMEDSKDDLTLQLTVATDSKNIVSQESYNEACKSLGLSGVFPDGWISSSKIDTCMKKINDIRRDFPGEKIIVFSQFTAMLTFFEVPLLAENIGYLRYDGSMDAQSRNQAITDFYETTIPVMLISLKAGNVGLTLTCASHVLLVDPSWNPYSEEQAMDRVHRIGQIRPVFIHKILTPDSVEDRIVELQEKKKELIDGALDETGMRNISRLSVDDIRFLFTGRRSQATAA